MRKISLFIVLIVVVCSFNIKVFAAEGDIETGFIPQTKEKITAEAIYLKSLDTGAVLYTKNADKKIYPASLTKIMTAVLAIENTPNLKTEMVEYPLEVQDYLYEYSLEHGSLSTGNLKAGEVRSMYEYLYAAMLPSANEAAMSIAVHVGGDLESFVDMMNARAKELGMNNTHFANPTGLFDEENYTTANDLAILVDHAKELEGFMDIAQTYKYEAGPSNMQDSLTWVSTIELQNPDLMPGDKFYYEGIKGIKTGTLPEAGHNYISTIQKDGYSYLLILIGCQPIESKPAFLETKIIYNWVFSSLRNQTLVGQEEVVGEIPVVYGKNADFVQLETNGYFTILIPDSIKISGDGAQVEKILDIPESLQAPVTKGQYIGDYVIKILGEEVGRVPLVAKANVTYSPATKFWYSIKEAGIILWVKIAAAVVLFLIILQIIRVLMRRRNMRRKYKAFQTKKKKF